jgi:hypothetical protein
VESKIDARRMEDFLCVPATSVVRMSITGTEEFGADVLYMEDIRYVPMKAVEIPSNIWMVVPVASVSLTEATLGVPNWVARPLPHTEQVVSKPLVNFMVAIHCVPNRAVILLSSSE